MDRDPTGFRFFVSGKGDDHHGNFRAFILGFPFIIRRIRMRLPAIIVFLICLASPSLAANCKAEELALEQGPSKGFEHLILQRKLKRCQNKLRRQARREARKLEPKKNRPTFPNQQDDDSSSNGNRDVANANTGSMTDDTTKADFPGEATNQVMPKPFGIAAPTTNQTAGAVMAQ